MFRLRGPRCKSSGANYITFVIRYEISAFAILFSLANSLSPKQYRRNFQDIFRLKLDTNTRKLDFMSNIYHK